MTLLTTLRNSTVAYALGRKFRDTCSLQNFLRRLRATGSVERRTPTYNVHCWKCRCYPGALSEGLTQVTTSSVSPVWRRRRTFWIWLLMFLLSLALNKNLKTNGCVYSPNCQRVVSTEIDAEILWLSCHIWI